MNILADTKAVSDEVVAIDRDGPLEPLLRSLALRMEGELRIVGKRPVHPALIAVSYAGNSYQEALRAIDASVFGLATVAFAEDGAVIELRYAD